jgi:hypothetical protein
MDGDLGPYDAGKVRLRAADTIIFLDFSLVRRTWGILPSLGNCHSGRRTMARTWRRRLAKGSGYGILVLLGLAALALTGRLTPPAAP